MISLYTFNRAGFILCRCLFQLVFQQTQDRIIQQTSLATCWILLFHPEIDVSITNSQFANMIKIFLKSSKKKNIQGIGEEMGKSWLYLGCSLQEYKATGQLCLNRLLSVYFRLEYKQGNNTSRHVTPKNMIFTMMVKKCQLQIALRL